MSRLMNRLSCTVLLVVALALIPSGRAAAQACLGDCNNNGRTTAGEVTNVIALILNCDGNAQGCSLVTSPCENADKNGNGIISAGELTNIIFNILNFPETGCPPGTPAPTNTVAPTPTATQPAGAAVCGDGIKQEAAGEECDDGGICIGGDNAGTDCTSESDCIGHGVCTAGPKIGTACADSSECPSGECIKCKPFGGDGCAANCTNEKIISYNLLQGKLVTRCTAGANQGNACTTDDDCPDSRCQTGGCLGGENDGQRCTSNSECPDGRCFPQVIDQTTSGAFVHDGIIQLALPLSGSQKLTIGGERNGFITAVIKAADSVLPSIKVGTLACACVRAIAVKTCGGTLFDEDGQFSESCTPDFTDGDSVCAGKKPCAFVHGPGNASSGLLACDGPLEGVNLTFTQDAGMVPGELPPPAPTPQPNSSDPVITLTGTGGPGSAVLLNTSAIGTTTNGPDTRDKCVDTTDPPNADFGPDGIFCTDDDPQAARGVPNTLPQVTGTATALITNTNSSTQTDRSIGPFSYTGSPYDCANLTAANPSVSGAKVVGAFTSLNQPATGDIVVRNLFVPE